ncbi:uncharacterized protein HMPREF1541_09340 [Cyphellophora europaea CBS 101466]|uniref:Uncharacterized protein n=1 Tax=Cyphellophora europaea (strain CBS 101466) TaxID=1220924 RepID=W2SBW8_CYPE1|nr:uncharacterized protein HMPREF1541_09340 [Cyphellophora europaea CBS 101466]ETN45508.1 hypothetical protein HMPREF1541_09340 [Cyphellophora europaea CBS 101466]
MAFNTTVLITGAKAGIGKGLLSAYAARPSTRVIAAIRDGTGSVAAKALENIQTGQGSEIVVVEYNASLPKAASELVSTLRNEHHIDSLNVVIANAGILKHFGLAENITAEDLQEHFNVNTVAPILLYKATAPLLRRSRQTPKFFIISSNIGSNGLMDNYPMPMLAYGLSKAAVNFAASRIHREEKDIVVVPAQPGWVQTAMGEKAATFAGMEPSDVPVTLEASVEGLMKLFDAANKEEHSGKFWDQNGKQMPW